MSHSNCILLTAVKFTSNVASTCQTMWLKFYVDTSFCSAKNCQSGNVKQTCEKLRKILVWQHCKVLIKNKKKCQFGNVANIW